MHQGQAMWRKYLTTNCGSLISLLTFPKDSISMLCRLKSRWIFLFTSILRKLHVRDADHKMLAGLLPAAKPRCKQRQGLCPYSPWALGPKPRASRASAQSILSPPVTLRREPVSWVLSAQLQPESHQKVCSRDLWKKKKKTTSFHTKIRSKCVHGKQNSRRETSFPASFS